MLPRIWLATSAGPIDTAARRAFGLRDGDLIRYICDDGFEYEGRVRGDGVFELHRQRPDVELPWRITLYLAALKGEQMRYVIEQATELGLAELVPVETAQSEVRRPFRHVPKWQQVARETAARCGRVVAPRIHEGMSFEDAIAARPVVALERRPDLAPLQPTGVDTGILVGPEAGFSEGELAQMQGLPAVTFGPRMLRALTAAAAVVAVLAVRPPGR